MVSLIDRHVFAEWLRAFILSVGAVLGIILLEDVFNKLKDLLDYGASGAEIAHYYWVLLPSLLPGLIPISLLVSVLFSLGNLHRDGEIIALRASGCGMWRITRTVWITGAFLAVFVFALHARWAPWSVEESRRIWDNHRFAHQLTQGNNEQGVGIIHNLAFFNHAENRIWFLNRFSEYDYRGFGITVSQLDASGREVSRLIANEGHFDTYDGYWVFLRGREITFDPDSDDAIRSQVFETRELQAFHEDPLLMHFLEKRPRDLSFHEIGHILGAAPSRENPRVTPYAVRYYVTMVSPLACFFAVAVAIPFAIRGVRVNPMVGVSKSIGLFFVFHIASSVFVLLGEKGLFEPWVVAAIPYLLILPVLFWLYRPAV